MNIIDDNRLETRLSASPCSAQRAAQIVLLRRAGLIASDEAAIEASNMGDRAFRSFVATLADLSSKGKGASQPAAADADDDDETDEELRKIAANATLRATADGTSTVSTKKLRDAIKAKRAAEDDGDVDEASLARNGLSEAHAAGKKANAPGALGESTLERCRALQDKGGATDGERAAGVLATLRALEGRK